MKTMPEQGTFVTIGAGRVVWQVTGTHAFTDGPPTHATLVDAKRGYTHRTEEYARLRQVEAPR